MVATAGSTLIARIPVSELAGVTAWISISLMNWSHWKRLIKIRRLDRVAFLATCLGILFFNAVAAILIGTDLYVLHSLDIRHLAARRRR